MRHVTPLLLGIILLSSTADAQEPARVGLLVDAGFASPQSIAFKNTWGTGIIGEGGVTFRLNNWFALQAVVGHGRFGVDEEALLEQLTSYSNSEASVSVQGGEISTWSFMGEGKISLSGNPNDVVPYALLGAGLCRGSEAPSTIRLIFQGELYDEQTTAGESFSDATVSVGAGVDVPVKEQMRFFVEARYQIVLKETESLEHVGLRAGFRFSF
jgi:outer membrane autotransporter protein